MKRQHVLRLAVTAALAAAAALTSVQPAAGAGVGIGLPGGPGGGGYGPPGQPPPQEAWAWTQLTPEGTQVRFVTPAAACPILLVTIGTAKPVRHTMVLEGQADHYPARATVCTRLVASAATAARIDVNTTGGIPVRPDAGGTVPLPNWTQPKAPTRRPASIALIGDTGCRLAATGASQTCSPQDWPFQRVADSAAASPVPPNLVIHLGDYIYRSRPAQDPKPLCDGSAANPGTHTWGCLVTDFFEPAAKLLARAPFVFVRGNHETCGRSGRVWFRYLASPPSLTACDTSPPQDYSPPVRVRAGSLGLLLTDTSCASDEVTPPTCDQTHQVARYTAQFDDVNSKLVQPGDNFLLSHTPVWSVNGQTSVGNPKWIDSDLETAVARTAAGMLDQRINLVLSGHVHLYQMLDFGASTAARRPPQVVSGASGTELDQKTWQDAALIGKPVDGVPLGHLLTVREFGYAVLRDTGATWNLRYFDRLGAQAPGTSCDLAGAQFPSCT